MRSGRDRRGTIGQAIHRAALATGRRLPAVADMAVPETGTDADINIAVTARPTATAAIRPAMALDTVPAAIVPDDAGAAADTANHRHSKSTRRFR